MMNWAKQTLANVAGTREPIYGPEAIRSVAQQAKETPYTQLEKKDFKWITQDTTNVETQTFYFMAESGHMGFAQVIHSNVAGLRTTVQFNSRIFYPGQSKPNLWSSNPMSDVDFSEDKTSIYATNVAVELSEDGKSYSIKSMTNENSIVNLTFTQVAPPFHAGKDGYTYYGTDPKAPWGSMRHAFWPRNTVTGTITTKDETIDCKGQGMFIHCLQGMKPHHAAAKWKFANFQSENYSAVMMELITPPSYGTTTVTVGGLVKGSEIITAGTDNIATWTKTKVDPECDWPDAEEAKFEWKGKTKDGKDVTAVVEGPLDKKLDRVDIMAEVPGFIKTIVAGAAGTKPYIYQYGPQSATLKIKIGDEEIVEKGRLFAEATYIVET